MDGVLVTNMRQWPGELGKTMKTVDGYVMVTRVMVGLGSLGLSAMWLSSL